MNKQTLNNIKMYHDFLLQQIDRDFVENTDDQYDENIWFFDAQYERIMDTLIYTLHEYSVDWGIFIEGVSYLDRCAKLIDAVHQCLEGKIGLKKIYVNNEKHRKGVYNILDEIKKNINIDMFDGFNHGVIYVEGDRRYLDLIHRQLNNHPVYRKFAKSFVEHCEPGFDDIPCQSWYEHYDEADGLVENDWCYNNCKKKLLRIDTRDYISPAEYIQNCFNNK